MDRAIGRALARGAAAALLAGLAAGLGVAQEVPTLGVDDARDLTADGNVFVEVVAERDSCFVHEPVRLLVRCGIEEEFLRASLIQPFARPLDVPVQVQAPWLEALPGFVLPFAAATGAASPGTRFALNDRLVRATGAERVLRDGRNFEIVEVEAMVRPDVVGSLALPAPLARFAFATRFRDDVFIGRVAEDRQDAFVRGSAWSLTVRPLPEESRPPSFSGAVGGFAVEATATPEEVVAGETVEVVVRIAGEGSLDDLTPAPLELEGFRVRGGVVEPDGESSALRYEVVPRTADVDAVPPIPFTFFDPQPPAGYETAWTEAVPLVVHPAPVPGVDDIHGLKRPRGAAPPPTASPARPGLGWVLVVVLAPWCVAGLVVVRRRAQLARNPARRRARQAVLDFRSCVEEEGTDLAQDVAEYLAARLDCAAAAVISHDLAARLEAAGLGAPLAGRTAAFLDELVGARYGGQVPADAAATACALVDELEEAFLAGERAG